VALAASSNCFNSSHHPAEPAAASKNDQRAFAVQKDAIEFALTRRHTDWLLIYFPSVAALTPAAVEAAMLSCVPLDPASR